MNQHIRHGNVGRLERVRDPASPLLRPSLDIIQQSIAAREQLDESWLCRLLQRGDYQLHAFVSDEDLIGAAVLYLPEGETFAVLDYLAVRADCRGRGVGSALGHAVIDLVARERPTADVLLLEVDDEREGDANARAYATRRIAFYRRLGLALLTNTPYLFPAHRGAPVPMRLMVYRFGNRADLSRQRLHQIVESLFVNVHGRSADDQLLRSIVASWPERVATSTSVNPSSAGVTE